MRILLIFIALVISNTSQATNCPFVSKKNVKTKITQMKYSDGSCSILVSPDTPFAQSYRSFNFKSDGMLMVFNSFGDGPNSSHTGSRVYFLFPRGTADLKFSLNEETQELVIETPAADLITINTKTTEVISFSGTQHKTDNQVNRQNKGGFEIQKYHGILMDMGWRLGGSPTEKLDLKSKFSDSLGNSCEILNRELFIKTPASEFEMKHSDNELFGLLKARCPGLVF